MELEFFCKPGTDMEWFEYWRSFCINWLKDLGIKDDEMRARDHSPEELVSTPREQQISSIYSHLDGVSSGESLTEQITI